jgi:hypothetical protein
MCESNKFLRSPPSLPAAVYLCYFDFPSLLVVVGDTLACKSSAVDYRCIMMSRLRLSNFSWGPVQDQDPQFSLINHEA